jgi:hypothetical protein
MLDALRFVASAVAKKDFVPELTHFKIEAGRVTGFNGQIALSSPIDVDMDIRPQARQLIDAIRACAGVISLSMTPAGRLTVRDEKFRAHINCLAEDHGHFVLPQGEVVELGENFLPGLKALAPVMGIDASRPWSMGIRVGPQSMLATNNVMLAEYWHGDPFPLDVVIPAAAVTELLRIDEVPQRAQLTDSSISFWFKGERWMRTQLLLGGAWPVERLNEIMGLEAKDQQPLPTNLGEQVEVLKAFLGDRSTVFVTTDSLATSPAEGEGAAVSVELPGVTEMQAYHHKQLTLLAQVAKTIDWSNYPQPCMFRGDRLRGAIIGQRL